MGKSNHQQKSPIGMINQRDIWAIPNLTGVHAFSWFLFSCFFHFIPACRGVKMEMAQKCVWLTCHRGWFWHVSFLPFHDNKTLQRVGTFDLSHACMLCAAHKQKIQLNLEFQFVCATCQNCVGCMHAQSELICRVPDPLPFAGFILKRRKYSTHLRNDTPYMNWSFEMIQGPFWPS